MLAKDNFREGYILISRPIDFAELAVTIPKFAIFYAYLEQPLMEKVLNGEGEELKAEMLNPRSSLLTPSGNKRFSKGLFEGEDDYSERMAKEFDHLEKSSEYHNLHHKGNIVQIQVEGVLCRLYPEDYTELSSDAYEQILNDDAYIVVAENQSVFNLPEVKDRVFYLRSRGISEKIAQRLASYGLKDLVIYYPHPELQKMYCRQHEVSYMPQFQSYYMGVYGGFKKFKETC